MDELDKYLPVIDRFLSGTLPGMNHARHVAIANVVMRLPHGRELVHLGLQVRVRIGSGSARDRGGKGGSLLDGQRVEREVLGA